MSTLELSALSAQIAELEAENTALKAQKFAAKINRKLTPKVSAKGAVSVYGLGQWPVTLYLEQWLALANNMPLIQSFISSNLAQLTVKA